MFRSRRTVTMLYLVGLFLLLIFSPGVMAQEAEPISNNADWVSRVANDDTGNPIVQVPAGCFMMGSDDEGAGSNEQGVHEVCFENSFFIDQYEVSNAQVGDSTEITTPSQFKDPQQPRDSVLWQDAVNYCASRTIDGHPMRLPTEAEWEYAARGPSNLIYPFGNEPGQAIGVIYDNSNGTTQSIGLYASGASWVGAEDMAGNVWEWTSSIGGSKYPYPYNPDDGRESLDDPISPRILRGGAANTIIEDIRSTNRLLRSPNTAFAMIGFRCASDFVGTPPPPPPPLPEPEIINRVEMVSIKAGCFQMGSTDDRAEDNEYLIKAIDEREERDVLEVCIENDFYMDVYEVTNEQAALFNVTFADQGRFTDARQPRDSVTWIEARDYCAARGGRLPTEEEWEYAARGSISNLYPWGNNFGSGEADYLIWQYNAVGQSFPVGSRPTDTSVFNVADVAGNVSEWTSTIYEPYSIGERVGLVNNSDTDSPRVIRGVDYLSAQFPRLSIRDSLNPSEFRETVGFRCVIDTEPPPDTVCEPPTNKITATLVINEIRVLDTRADESEPDHIELRYFFNQANAVSDVSKSFTGEVRIDDELFSFESIALDETCEVSLSIIIRLFEGAETQIALGDIVRDTINLPDDWDETSVITETIEFSGVTDNNEPYDYRVRYTVDIQSRN